MTRINMHIHSKYSWDCNMTIKNISSSMAKRKIRYGAITDHVEFDRENIDEVIDKLKLRNKEIDEVNKQREGKVTLLKAVEISEPHLYKDEVARLSELDLDMIMGSIHNFDRTAKTDSEKAHATYLYYVEMMKMIEAGQIDVIGHLDYIRRAYPNAYCSPNQVSEILHAIKDRKLVPEVNSSAKRRIGASVFPSSTKLVDYKLIGGDNVTIGTDAHLPFDLLDNIEEAEELVKQLKLQPIIYRERKIEII